MHIQGGKKLTNYVDNILLVGQSKPVPSLTIGKIQKIRSNASPLLNLPFKIIRGDDGVTFVKNGIIKNEEAHFQGSAKSQEIEVLQSMKTTKWLNSENEAFTIKDYSTAMEEYLGYEMTSNKTPYNWLNKLVKLGIVKKLEHNMYQPIWDAIEDSV